MEKMVHGFRSQTRIINHGFLKLRKRSRRDFAICVIGDQFLILRIKQHNEKQTHIAMIHELVPSALNGRRELPKFSMRFGIFRLPNFVVFGKQGFVVKPAFDDGNIGLLPKWIDIFAKIPGNPAF